MTPDKALSLANDIACAIATLREIEDELRTAYPSADYRDCTDDEPEHETSAPKTSEPEVTLDSVRAVLSAKAADGKREEVKSLLGKYGVSQLSAVKPVQYAALLADAEGL